MARPTTTPSLSSQSSASVEGAAVIEKMFEQTAALSQIIQREREQLFADRESVYSYDISDAVSDFDEPIVIPEEKLEQIQGVNDSQWVHTYNGILCWDNHSEKDKFAVTSEYPDGRLSWFDSLEAYRDSNSIGYEKRTMFPYRWISEATPSYIRIDVPNTSTPVTIYTDNDVTKTLSEGGYLSIQVHTKRSQEFLEYITGDKVDEVMVSTGISYQNQQRTYATKDDITDESILLKLSALSSEPSKKNFHEVITCGAFTRHERYLLSLLESGVKNSVSISYAMRSRIIDSLIESMGYEYMNVPQTGNIIISNNLPSQVCNPSDSFPAEQSLSKDKEREILRTLDWPDYAIDFSLNETVTVPSNYSIEMLAIMFDSDEVNADDINNFKCCPWPVPGEREYIYEAIKTGRKFKEAVQTWGSSLEKCEIASDVANYKRFKFESL